jgi:flagellar hook protein FlgE
VINTMFNILSGMVASAQKLKNSANNIVSLGRNKVTVVDNSELRSDLNSTKTSKKVDISKEMVNQITAQAEFKANAKVIMAADKTIGTILNIKS